MSLVFSASDIPISSSWVQHRKAGAGPVPDTPGRRSGERGDTGHRDGETLGLFQSLSIP